MPLNPDIARVLDMIARTRQPSYASQTPQAVRAAYARSAPILDLAPAPMASVDDLSVPTRDGAAIRARLYLPVEPSLADPLPALVYFHGGGFTIGSVDTHDALCRMFARDAQCAVLSVDYRLAPEATFPTAHDDADDAFAWLHRHAGEFGIDAARLAVGGDSAGGTLAAAVAVLARDRGLSPRLQLLIYPGLTAFQQTDSHARLAHGYLLTAETIQWFFSQYVPNRADREDWRFAPLDGTRGAPSFAGLAPAWIAVAEYDPLCDEGEAYAQKLRAAGNAVELVRYDGMIHEFFKMGGFVPAVRQAHADAAKALRAAFEAD
ncbi:alpha/beta hydrolase [Burkholderia sp. Ac-20379]|uniref:alpha/beta hydrolase n=1 Tax=Burkholderia sp. Ac-20379 TaxID=2703900 RepID=UPI0019821AEC|nr:alpha/beta hydrolase [Burkholderia sp. Ac-20379]MBN3724101.1 alpha/beta hydrolase [Burkholderia sp. Ac-20379]